MAKALPKKGWNAPHGRDIAERIAAAFDEVYAWASKEKKREARITHVVETVQLSKRLISDEEYAYASRATRRRWPRNTARMAIRRSACSKIPCCIACATAIGASSIAMRRKGTAQVSYELHVIGLDDVAFASNQFELYMDYQHRIQARSPFVQTFVVQLAGQSGEGGGSYLCTQRGFEGRGYSASMYCNLVSPAGGQELVEETVRLLKEIRASQEE